MEFAEVVRRRRMVRRFVDLPVDGAVLDRMIEHATRAPNAGFSQGWSFLVLDEPTAVRRFWSASSADLAAPDRWLAGMMTAPALILPCSSRAAYLERYAATDKDGTRARNEAPADADGPWSMPYWHLDTAMAALLILQTAVDEGLGACFFGLPPQREAAIRHEFAIPAEFDPIGAIAIGHPDTSAERTGSARSRARRPLREVLHRNGWVE